jgi:serine/threonine protein phosphatase PrpC
MSAHFVSLKGDRETNEDNHNIILGLDNNSTDLAKVNYYGIYDGHGGKFVSKFLSENLPHCFTASKVKYPLERDYVNRVYDKVQNILFTKYEKESMGCGSTCIIACHFRENGRDYLNIINSGDSRCIVCRNNIASVLTLDHKPDWPIETNRITKLGGQVKKIGATYRINDLSVSRAFGDKESRKYVTHRPDLYKYKITKNDKFIVIACDGLWDVLSPQEVANLILKNCYDSDMKRINVTVNSARMLASHAIGKKCGDNVTCIVVFF